MKGVKKDCYWYREEQDMGAVIPDCEAIKSFPLTQDDCENCEKYHSKYKQTRADRIRAKTDEELAEWIMSIEPAACPFRDDHGDDCHFTHCKDCWLESLRQDDDE